MIVLPYSFTGGPRYIHERTQDAMTYVQNYGHPDIFVIFMCNPRWKEITNSLLSGQKADDCLDIIARVFRIKVKRIIDLLTKGKYLKKYDFTCIP